MTNEPAGNTEVPTGEREVPTIDAQLISVAPLTDRHLISLPDPSAEGLEGLLGQANDRRLADALDRINRHLPGQVLRPDEDGASGSADVFDVSLQVTADELWDAMTTIAHHDNLHPGRIAFGLSAAEEGVDDHLAFATSYGIHRPNLGAVGVKAQHGAAVAIHGIEWHVAALYGLVADLETVGGRPCSASVIVVTGPAIHEEPAERLVDVLITPVDGAVVARRRVPASAGEDVSAPADGGVSGEQATVPPGRAVVALAGQSVAFSAADGGCVLLVRVELPMADPWVDVLAAQATARFHPLLRADLPTSFQRPIESYGGTLYDDLSKFRAEVEAALGPKALDHAAAFARAGLPPRTSRDVGLLTSLAFRAEPHGDVRSPAHAGVMVTQVDDAQHLVVGGGVFTFPEGVAEVMAPLLDGRPLEVAEVLGRIASTGLDDVDARKTLIELVHAELLEPLR
ncbi:MAG: hypothetical protein M9952_04685 [Microthrixaceae bacterium]|nr:hypothetical protein [Microthrixaceae bacterium]